CFDRWRAPDLVPEVRAAYRRFTAVLYSGLEDTGLLPRLDADTLEPLPLAASPPPGVTVRWVPDAERPLGTLVKFPGFIRAGESATWDVSHGPSLPPLLAEWWHLPPPAFPQVGHGEPLQKWYSRVQELKWKPDTAA